MTQPQQAQALDPVTGHPARKPGRPRNPIQTATDMTIKAMILQGASIRGIAKALNIGQSTVARIRSRIVNAPGAAEECPGLLSPKRDELAGKVIDRFLEAGSKMKRIRGSDALGAVKLYSDRRWPTRKDDAPGPQSFTAVFIQEARIELPGAPSHTTRGISPHQELPDAGHPQSNQILEAEFRDG